MSSIINLYKLLKYSNKTNDINYLKGVTKNNINSKCKSAKKSYINNQKGGEHIDLSECKEIYISNFHGMMSGNTIKIPNNTWVIVPYGAGFINYLGKDEKEFFLQNREKLLEEFDKNTGKAIHLFGKNFLILKPGDSYCDVNLEIKFDNMIDEGLYEIEHAQKMIEDPLYRKINFGDIFQNPLEENYLVGFNISPKYKEILRLYLSKKNIIFDSNSIKNNPKKFIKSVKNKLNTQWDRMYKLQNFSKNYDLVVNNISRIMYPLLIEQTLDTLISIYSGLLKQINEFELPPDNDTGEYSYYNYIITNFKNTWGNDEIEKIAEQREKYETIVKKIDLILWVLEDRINTIKEKNFHTKFPDNFKKFESIRENIIKKIKEELNYELIIDTISHQYFDNSSDKKISLIDSVKTTFEDKKYPVLMIDSENKLYVTPVFDLMEKLDVNVKSFITALFFWTWFHLLHFRIFSIMSAITLNFLKDYLINLKPIYLSDVIRQVVKTSREKRIIFSRSCQGFDPEISIENAAQCLKYTTDYDLTNVFNQNNGTKLTEAITYIKKNKLDDIFDEDVGQQDAKIYTDLICIFSDNVPKSDIISKIFIIYLKRNFIEIYNYFKFNMELPIPIHEKSSLIAYQIKTVMLIINLYIKSVYDKTEQIHKKNISDIMNS